MNWVVWRREDLAIGLNVKKIILLASWFIYKNMFAYLLKPSGFHGSHPVNRKSRSKKRRK
jgi:hypothetical protein